MNIHYVTGSRADFGLMCKTLQHLNTLPEIQLHAVVTGQHLLPQYGETVCDIEAAGIDIAHRIPVALSGSGGHEMGRALAHEMLGFLDAWAADKPDLVLVLGDRGEMLAAALAAVHLGIHIGHIHGGERSGTLDESFRHAISKLSHFHFTSSTDASDRLERMGEDPAHIFTIGAPGLVGLADNAVKSEGWIEAQFGLTPAETCVLVVFHPVVQETGEAAAQMKTLLDMLAANGCYGLLFLPNSDAGSDGIEQVIAAFMKDSQNAKRFKTIDHLARSQYLSCLANADMIIGNSSSGIIESASFNIPCLNIGTRQNMRLRNDNTIDCPDISAAPLSRAFAQARQLKGPFHNAYGGGDTDKKLADILRNLPLPQSALAKCNIY